MAEQRVERPLFGGAITCQIPEDWRDVSNVRPVPDHQECWQQQQVSTVDVEGERDLGGAVWIVEILEHQTTVPPAQAAGYFFNDLADANEWNLTQSSFSSYQPMLVSAAVATDHPSCLPAGLPNDAVVCIGSGTVQLGNDSSRNERWPVLAAGVAAGNGGAMIAIHLAVIRLPNQTTDLLVSLTKPMRSIDSVAADGIANRHAVDSQEQAERFGHLLASLRIQDWSLFG